MVLGTLGHFDYFGARGRLQHEFVIVQQLVQIHFLHRQLDTVFILRPADHKAMRERHAAVSLVIFIARVGQNVAVPVQYDLPGDQQV